MRSEISRVQGTCCVAGDAAGASILRLLSIPAGAVLTAFQEVEMLDFSSKMLVHWWDARHLCGCILLVFLTRRVFAGLIARSYVSRNRVMK